MLPAYIASKRLRLKLVLLLYYSSENQEIVIKYATRARFQTLSICQRNISLKFHAKVEKLCERFSYFSFQIFLHSIRQSGFTNITYILRFGDHHFGWSLKSSCLKITGNYPEKGMLLKKRTTTSQIFQ